jgi:PAS domain S-box-containing protein
LRRSDIRSTQPKLPWVNPNPATQAAVYPSDQQLNVTLATPGGMATRKFSMKLRQKTFLLMGAVLISTQSLVCLIAWQLIFRPIQKSQPQQAQPQSEVMVEHLINALIDLPTQLALVDRQPNFFAPSPQIKQLLLKLLLLKPPSEIPIAGLIETASGLLLIPRQWAIASDKITLPAIERKSSLLFLRVNSDRQRLISQRYLPWIFVGLGLTFNVVILILIERQRRQNLSQIQEKLTTILDIVAAENRPSSMNNSGIQSAIASPEKISPILAQLNQIQAEFNQIKQAKNQIESYYNAIADYGNCLITRQTLDGVFLYVSSGCRQLLGYQPEEMMGISVQDLLHPEDLPQVNRAYAIIKEKPVTLTFSHRYQRKGGDYIWLETTSKVLADSSAPENLEVLWISHDITDRHETESELEHNQESIRQLCRITADPQLDFSQKIAHLLEMGCRHFSLNVGILSQIEENNYTAIASHFEPPLEPAENPGNVLKQIASGQRISLNETYCKKTYQTQKIVYFESLMVSPWHSESINSILDQKAYLGCPVMVNEKIYGTLSFFSSQPREIPFKSQDQELLQLMAQWIGTELQRIQSAEKIAQMRDEAIAATQAKSEFLATMSHEIRTPMNAVIGLTSLLLDTPLTSEQKDFVTTIQNSGDALLTIINDILDLSKMEAGKMDLEYQPFYLEDCLEDTIELLANKANNKGIELGYIIDECTPNLILGDLNRLRQILVNLLSNAIKFTDRGEVILLVTSQLKTKKEAKEWQDLTDLPLKHEGILPETTTQKISEIIFLIKDTGIGIPANKISRLFKSFSQADAATSRQYGGTGLGLAISNSLTLMMGGTMWVTSGGALAGTPPQNWEQLPNGSQSFIDTFLPKNDASSLNVGATFGFTIVAPEISTSSLLLISPGEENYLTNKRVLIVDDNPTILKILSRETQSWGMKVATATSSAEALSLLPNQAPFDLVILDMQMPEMDGIALSAEIRALDNYATVPLLMMIPLGTKLNHRDQFTAYLNKPIKKSLMFNVVSGIFGKQTLTSQSVEPEINLGNSSPTQAVTLRILLAEDHPVNQKVALQMLERMGHQTDIATNGLEAIALIQQKTYDVVLMDVQMPEMNGLEAAQKIREASSSGQLAYRPRIIAMTANAMSGDREACLAAGMDDYISKPIRMIELSQALSVCQPLDPTQQTIQTTHRDPSPPSPPTFTSIPEPPQEPQQDSHNSESLLDANILNSLREIDALEEVIEIYLTESPKLLQKMAEAIEQGDPAKLRDAAHSLKSTSGAIGANTLAQLNQTLELMTRAGNTAEAPVLIGKIATEYARVKAALEQEIQAS